MKYEDIIAAARIVRKYIKAVEVTLYWNMTTREAREEIAEAERVFDILETAAAAENTEVK
jgi:hypothetical protein